MDTRNSSKKLIIAHRGYHKYSVENTLESFQNAVDIKADMIELDLRMTWDKKIIIFHDSHINGTQVNQLTYKQISSYARKKSFKVPLFTETLKALNNKIKLNIEVKEQGFEKKILQSIKQENFNEENIIISSFQDEIIQKIKQIAPDIKTGLLLIAKKNLKEKLSAIFPHKRAEQTKTDFFIAHTSLLKYGFILRAKLPVIVWGVNEKKLIKKLISNKKTVGIITDFPDTAIDLINK